MSRKRRKTTERSQVRPSLVSQENAQEKRTLPATSVPLLAADAYYNSLAFLGEASELNAANGFERNSITRNTELLTVMYRENWIAKRIIDTPCEDMTRAWYTLSTSLDQKKLDELSALEEKHNIKQEFTNALRWARLYGGSAAIIVIKGQEDMLDQPLNYEDLMPGCFRGVQVVDRSSGVFPSVELEEDWDDPEYNYPKYYDVVLNNGNNDIVRVHHSRVITFRGRMLPPTEEQAESYWGASELEHVYEELQKRNSTSANIAQLVFQANVTVTKMSDYGEVMGMGTERQKQQVMNTIFEQNRIKNAFGTMIMGKDDNYEQHAYAFGGLQEIYELFMMDISGCSEIPATKLYGRSPQGMNATGESDMKNYDEMISQSQESKLRPALSKLLPVMAMSLWGEIPEDMQIVFNPVLTTTPKERADIINQFTSTIVSAFQAGLISQKNALMELVNSCKDVGAWTSITQEVIDKASDEVDGGEMGGMGGMGAGPGAGPEGMAGMMGMPEIPEDEAEENKAQEMAEKEPVSAPEEPKKEMDRVETEAHEKPSESQIKPIDIPKRLNLDEVKARIMEAARNGDLETARKLVRENRDVLSGVKKTKAESKHEADEKPRRRFLHDAFAALARMFRGRDDEKEDTGWKTDENGKHFHIGEGGEVDKGPNYIKGKNINDPALKSSPAPSGSSKSGSSAKKGYQWISAGVKERIEKNTKPANKAEFNSKVEVQRQEVLQGDASDKGLFLHQQKFLPDEKLLAAMKDGSIDQLVNDYFDLVKENGDTTPTKEARDAQQAVNDIREKVDSGKYPGYTEARQQYIADWTGLSKYEAGKVAGQFNVWFGGMWNHADTEMLDGYIDLDGYYDGSIYRGMHFTEEKYQEFMKDVSVGNRIGMDGNASWTTNEEVAWGFSRGEDRHVRIICQENKTSAPVDHLSTQGEYEVISHSKALWTVMRVDEGMDTTIIYVREAADRMSDEERDRRKEKPNEEGNKYYSDYHSWDEKPEDESKEQAYCPLEKRMQEQTANMFVIPREEIRNRQK